MKGKQKIGVLAQEIQEVFPELVSEDDSKLSRAHLKSNKKKLKPKNVA